MTLFADHTYSRVMVFIDYRNVYEGVRFGLEGTELDLSRLTRILVGDRDLVGAYIFDGIPKQTDSDDHMPEKTRAYHNFVREQGFRVIARESVVKQEGKFVQKEVDVSLACEMLEHALMNHFDVAIVVSGDRDFVPAIQKVQSAGKRVEVAAFSNELNQECKRAADVYYTLDDLPIMAMRSPVDQGGDARWPISSTCRGTWGSTTVRCHPWHPSSTS